jgi:hypothetical protein
LSDENFFWGYFHGEITTADHDTVSSGEDLIVIVEGLLVLNFSNDLDILSFFTKSIVDTFNVFSLSNSSSGDVVDSVCNSRLDVFSIFFGENGEVNACARNGEYLVLS